MSDERGWVRMARDFNLLSQFSRESQDQSPSGVLIQIVRWRHRTIGKFNNPAPGLLPKFLLPVFVMRVKGGKSEERRPHTSQICFGRWQALVQPTRIHAIQTCASSSQPCRYA